MFLKQTVFLCKQNIITFFEWQSFNIFRVELFLMFGPFKKLNHKNLGGITLNCCGSTADPMTHMPENLIYWLPINGFKENKKLK